MSRRHLTLVSLLRGRGGGRRGGSRGDEPVAGGLLAHNHERDGQADYQNRAEHAEERTTGEGGLIGGFGPAHLGQRTFGDDGRAGRRLRWECGEITAAFDAKARLSNHRRAALWTKAHDFLWEAGARRARLPFLQVTNKLRSRTKTLLKNRDSCQHR